MSVTTQEYFDQIEKTNARLQEENERLKKAITNFCEGQSGSVEFWKNQSHIKPLFDIAKEIEK